MREMIGGLDRHRHRGAEHRLCFCGGLHCLFVSSIEDGEYLLHDMIEDDAAAKGRFDDDGKASRFIECAVVEAQRVIGSTLKARDKLLLQPNRLENGIIVALPCKRSVSGR